MRFNWLRNIKEELFLAEINRTSIGKSYILNVLCHYCIGLALFIAVTISLVPIIVSAIADHLVSLYYYIKDYKKNRIKAIRIKARMLEYEEELINEGLLYLMDHQNGRVLVQNDFYYHSVNDFVKHFIKSYRNGYNTHSLSNETLYCNIGRRRSLGDIYKLCKHYIPKTTLEKVIKAVIIYTQDGTFSHQRCSTIQKYVFHTDSAYNNPKDITEYGRYIDINNYSQAITWQDIVDIYK